MEIVSNILKISWQKLKYFTQVEIHQEEINIVENIESENEGSIFEGGIKTLYHKTTPEIAASILQSQIFLCGDSGTHGGGIYFASEARSTHHKSSPGMSNAPKISSNSLGEKIKKDPNYPCYSPNFRNEIFTNFPEIVKHHNMEYEDTPYEIIFIRNKEYKTKKNKREGVILKCKVNLGKTLTTRRQDAPSKYFWHNFDSILYKRSITESWRKGKKKVVSALDYQNFNDEYIVYSLERIIDCSIVVHGPPPENILPNEKKRIIERKIKLDNGEEKTIKFILDWEDWKPKDDMGSYINIVKHKVTNTHEQSAYPLVEPDFQTAYNNKILIQNGVCGNISYNDTNDEIVYRNIYALGSDDKEIRGLRGGNRTKKNIFRNKKKKNSRRIFTYKK